MKMSRLRNHPNTWEAARYNKSRFILPCKSDRPPVFLKMQGIYSLYAKSWLESPLIKQIHDSSTQYLSDEVGESICKNSGVTQFHTQFTHVSRHFWAKNKKVRKNCIDNVASDLWIQLLIMSNKMLWNKVLFQDFKIDMFKFFAFF